MDPFTLVIFWLVGSTPMEHRTPDLTETECKRMAAGVVAPKQAKCVQENARNKRDATFPVICPVLPPCWQNGRRLKSAMPGDFADNP